MSVNDEGSDGIQEPLLASNPQIHEYAPDTEEEKRFLRKLDLCLLPAVWFMFLLSYMDRTNIGNAMLAGMDDDLQLDDNRYSTALVVFFVPYILLEVPSNMLLSLVPPSIWLPLIMFLWGCVTLGMGWVRTYPELIVFRLAVGTLEAGFSPGVLFLLSAWYKRDEQSKRFAAFVSAGVLSGAVGGLLAGGIESGLDGRYGIDGWRWIFIIEGTCTAGFGVIAAFLLPNFPHNSRQFKDQERELAVARLNYDKQLIHGEVDSQVGHRQALKMAINSRTTWALAVAFMTIVGSNTLPYFLPALVQGLGYTDLAAQFMTVPIYAVAFVCCIATGFIVDRFPSQRGPAAGGWLLVASLFGLVTCVVHDYTARIEGYVFLVFIASGLWTANSTSWALSASLLSSVPTDVRAICFAFINGFGNLGSIFGAFLFPSDDAPEYILGFAMICGLSASGAAIYFGLYYISRKRIKL